MQPGIHSACKNIWLWILSSVYAGCEIHVGGPQGCRKSCVIAIHQQGMPVYMAVADEIELTKWFQALEQGIKMETPRRPKQEEQRRGDTLPTTSQKHSSRGSHAMKQSVKSSESQVQKTKKVRYLFILHIIHILHYLGICAFYESATQSRNY